MFKPEKVFHATIVLREDKAKELINTLHEEGVCELKESSAELPSKYSYELAKDVESIYTRLKFVRDSLEKYKEIPTPEGVLKQLFFPKKPLRYKITTAAASKVIEDVKKHIGLIEPKLVQSLAAKNEKEEKIKHNEFLISNLYLLPDVKTNLFESTDSISISLGIIAKSSFPMLSEKLKDKAIIGIKDLEEKEKKFAKLALAAILAFQEDKPMIDKVLHQIGFSMITIPHENAKPIRIIRRLREENESLRKGIEKKEIELKKMQQKHEKKLEILSEELEICKERIDALKLFKSSKALSFIEAWIPAKSMQHFNQIMSANAEDFYLEAEEKDDAPTIFKNPKLIRPFEMLTELYSPPKYKGFDPTPILAVSFALFFGFMLTDVAYGILLGLLAIGLIYGIGKYDESIKKFGSILLIFGVSTIILGVVFGSYFGNFFQELGIKMPRMIDSMKQVMVTMGFALTLGATHLFTGLTAGFYDNAKSKKIREAFAKQGVWIFFMIGILMIILKIKTAGFILIALAVLMQLFFNFQSDGAVSSALSIFGFTAFVGDFFSYARLMALCIGTSGIALAINFMAFLSIKTIPYAGILAAIIIFIVGHTFNMAMNGLGAFVHSTRLHFLEFFTKFYEGGGRLYKPFKAKRISTYLEGG